MHKVWDSFSFECICSLHHKDTGWFKSFNLRIHVSCTNNICHSDYKVVCDRNYSRQSGHVKTKTSSEVIYTYWSLKTNTSPFKRNRDPWSRRSLNVRSHLPLLSEFSLAKSSHFNSNPCDQEFCTRAKDFPTDFAVLNVDQQRFLVWKSLLLLMDIFPMKMHQCDQDRWMETRKKYCLMCWATWTWKY